MKTYTITKDSEFVEDKGDFYLLKRNEWELWFSGTEEFETKRGTKQFELIQVGFECAKAQRKVFDVFQKYNKAEK